MHALHARRHVGAPRAGGTHGTHGLALTILLAAAVALGLLLHGVSWWYAPLALPVLLLVHAIILGSTLVAMRPRSARAADGPGAPHPHDEQGEVLHRPRLYDGLVRFLTLGRERRLRRWTVDFADLSPGDAVLDVGSGTGSLLLEAAERVGPSGVLRGLEPSPAMAAHARRKAEGRGIPVAIVEGSAAHLPFPDASFDAVFCTLVLHHLPLPLRETAIREMRRVLRPAGRLIVVDWRRPRSRVKALFSPMFLAYSLHNRRPGASPLDSADVEVLLGDLGLRGIVQSYYGNGGLGAIVGRLSPGTPAARCEDRDGTA